MTQQNSNPKTNSQVGEDEIDLIALVKTVWEGRITIIKTTVLFMCIGLFVAIFSEKEYKASSTFVAQTSDTKVGGGLSGLAAMAGINLGGMSNESGIPPELYPLIISSIPFQMELLETPLTFEGEKDKMITFKDYYLNVKKTGILVYIKRYTIGLPRLIINLFKLKSNDEAPSIAKDSKLIIISKEEEGLMGLLNNQISLEINDEDGYVTISALMPEARLSAELAFAAQKLLQQYVINFKIKKSKEQLAYIKERYDEVEGKFKGVQRKLALYKDNNKFGATALGNTTLESIQDEYSLVYSVFTELSKQLEAQYLQVTEDTPVFTVLKPVSIPLDKLKPKRVMILFIWSFSGVIVGLGRVFGKKFITSFKNKFNYE